MIKIKQENTKNGFEGYWQITLCMLASCGLNSVNESEANLKWSVKNIFYLMQNQ